jgi:hypothetical protein
MGNMQGSLITIRRPSINYLKPTHRYCSTKSVESQLTPKYVNIKIKGNKQRTKNTKIGVTCRLTQEIISLYKKK